MVGARAEREALIAWSAVAEPGDADAGALVGAIGAVKALEFVTEGERDLARASIELGHRAGGQMAARAAKAHERWARRLSLADMPHEERASTVRARIVTRGDPHWPTALADLGQAAPFVLYVRGQADLDALWSTGVALVGARSATSYGTHVASELAAGLCGHGRAVISGGAYGIDAAAHRGALAAGGATVAVMAGGIDRLYPSGHEELLNRIADEWAVISEVPPGFAPHRSRFLARNRIIAAASGTVVVEAAHRSGALSTARHAANLLRPVAAVPGPVTSASSAGCHDLIRERVAELVADTADVIELVGPISGAATERAGSGHDASSAARAPGSLAVRAPLDFDTPAERAVFDVSSRRDKSLEEIASAAGIGLAAAAAACASLEARGLVGRSKGGFVRMRQM